MNFDDATKLDDDKFLLLTIRCLDETYLTDERILRELLIDLAGAIGMNPINAPSVCRAINNPGLEAYLPVDASNITVSTYTSSPRIVACIHSCKPFELSAVINVLRKVSDESGIRYHFCRESDFEVIS